MRQGPSEAEPITVAPVETIYVLPADELRVDTTVRAPWAKDVSILASIFGYLARLVFFAVAPFFVVLICFLGSHQSLTVLVLATLLFAGLIGQTPRLTEKWPWLLNIPLARDGLEVLNRLHAFYFEHRPRSFAFYVLYPITCPLYLLFARNVRREFRLCAGIIGTVIAAVLGEAVLAYSSTYPPHLGAIEAIVNTAFRLIFCLFVFVGFFIPVATTSFTYHLSYQPWRMRLLVLVGLLSAAPMIWVVYVDPIYPASFWSGTLLNSRLRVPGFRDSLKDSTEMFLLYQAPRQPEQPISEPTADAKLTDTYRRQIAGLAVNDEAKCFSVFTLAERPGRPWLGVRVYLSNGPHLVALADPDGRFYTSWAALPPSVQAQFHINPGASNAERRKLNVIDSAMLLDDTGAFGR